MKAMKAAKEEENKINEFKINQQNKKREKLIILDNEDDMEVGDGESLGWFIVL
jgi:hypothetical protein